MGDEDRAKIEELLGEVMGETRLARSFTIPDEDVKIKEANLKTIDAKIRDYTLKMDMASKTIVHVCGDWERAMQTRQLCKHFGKALLTFPHPAPLPGAS